MFAERLKTLRKNAGLTQKDMAQHFQTSQPSYQAWESGKRNPNKASLDKLATFFNVSVDYLLGKTDIKNPTNSSQPEIFFRKAVSDMNMTPEQEEQFQKDIINFIEQRKRIFEEDK